MTEYKSPTTEPTKQAGSDDQFIQPVPYPKPQYATLPSGNSRPNSWPRQAPQQNPMFNELLKRRATLPRQSLATQQLPYTAADIPAMKESMPFLNQNRRWAEWSEPERQQFLNYFRQQTQGASV